jgi:hypothetical protein
MVICIAVAALSCGQPNSMALRAGQIIIYPLPKAVPLAPMPRRRTVKAGVRGDGPLIP